MLLRQLPRTPLLRLSEKPRTRPEHSPTDHRKGRARTSFEFPSTNVTPTLLRPFLSPRVISTARETDRRSVRSKLPTSGLLPTLVGHAGCPDFLTPPPDASVATFGEELERLRATPAEVMHEEVEAFMRKEKEQFGSLAPDKARLLEIYLKDPEGSLKRLVDALGRYYDVAFAPYWPRIQEHLEGDLIKRGQALALGGVEALLSGLHPKASYGGGVLALDKTYEAVIEPAGRGITLVPCVFAWPRVEVLVQPGYRPTLAYGPRGVANLWTSSSPSPNGTALEAALSTGRAGVLKGLLPAPRTTTELARQLDLSPAAVSAHLSRLKAAELVEPHRSGKRVYYRLSGAGESLLGIFGELE
jgi:DNA-binding transcriptional ArsR family regulator